MSSHYRPHKNEHIKLQNTVYSSSSEINQLAKSNTNIIKHKLFAIIIVPQFILYNKSQ